MTAVIDPMAGVKATQDLVRQGLTKASGESLPAARLPSLVAPLIAVGRENVGKAAGEVGCRLWDAFDRLDLDHPDVDSVLTAEEHGVAAAAVAQVTAALVMLKEGKPTDAQQEALKAVDRLDDVIDLLTYPSPRLLKDAAERDGCRAAKRTAGVDLRRAVSQKGDEFYGRPVDFSMFARLSDRHVGEIDVLEGRRKLLHDHKMPAQAQAQKKRIDTIHEWLAGQFLGFRRMGPVEAGLQAGRTWGFKAAETAGIVKPAKAVRTPVWIDQNKTEKAKRVATLAADPEVRAALTLKKPAATQVIDLMSLAFRVRMYAPAAWPLAPCSETVEMLAKVDRLGELKGKSPFDYYWILVPTLEVKNPLFQPDGPTSGWAFQDGETVSKFADEAEATVFLDTLLVRTGQSVPVVLGERDRQCYFVGLYL